MRVKVGPLTADLEEHGRSAAEALAEIDREINLRIRLYPTWIAGRTLSAIDAKDRLERLAAAAQLVQGLLPPDDPAAGTVPATSDDLPMGHGEAKAGIVP